MMKEKNVFVLFGKFSSGRMLSLDELCWVYVVSKSAILDLVFMNSKKI